MKKDICRNCGREAIVDPSLGLGSVCLKKLGKETPKSVDNIIEIKVINKDLSKIPCTYNMHADGDEVPVDLLVHGALEEIGYEDYNYNNSEEIFRHVVKTFFNSKDIPNSFREKLNDIDFEIKGYLPRMVSSPWNYCNLIVGVKESKADLVLRVYADPDTGMMFFKTNPQYVIMGSSLDEMYLSIREEIEKSYTDGPSDFDYFIMKSSQSHRELYINNFPSWVDENCKSVMMDDKSNVYSTGNSTACKKRGRPKMEKYLKGMSEEELVNTAFCRMGLVDSPVGKKILERIISKSDNIDTPEGMFKASVDFDMEVYDLSLTKKGQMFQINLSNFFRDESDKTLNDLDGPESEENNSHVRRMFLIGEICKKRGYSSKKTSKMLSDIKNYLINFYS